MANEKLVELFRMLKQATSEKRVHWEETETGGTFRVSLGQAQLEIERERPSGFRKIPDSIEFSDKSQFKYNYVTYIKPNPASTNIEVEFFDPWHPHCQLVKDVYAAARVDALDLDKVIESMIASVPPSN